MNRNVFGFWKEYGKEYEDSPSISNYIDRNINKNYNKEKLLRYLNSGGIVCVTSRMNFPHAITQEVTSGSLAIKTDGLWEWPEDLVDYIANYNLYIPVEWYEYIKANNFLIPNKIKINNPDIDWDN